MNRRIEPVDLELKSKEIQEIIGRIPPWIIRSGMTMTFVLVSVLLVGSWFFKYPDTIPASIVIAKENNNINAKIIGKLCIQSANIGSVMPGQLVHIKLDRYSYTQFGIIMGTIQSVSTSTQDDNYLAVVDFPDKDKLITSYGKEIKLEFELKGSAEIVTGEVRLIQRIIQPLISLTSKP
jgi:hypothetical protein